MKTKDELLQAIRGALANGIITHADIHQLLGENNAVHVAVAPTDSKKLSIVGTIFHIVGVILFAAILSVVVQTWEAGAGLHVMLTAVLGLMIWAGAYAVTRMPEQNELREGLASALLLTGSLLVITGGFIVTNLVGGYGSIDFYEAIPALLILAGLHLGFYYLIKRDSLFVIGVLLSVATVGSLVFGLLRDAEATMDVWVVAWCLLAGLLAWVMNVLAGLSKASLHLKGACNKPAIVLVLLATFVASFGELALLWYVVLIMAILGVFYLSIRSKERILLGTASLFLVLVIITISFRYFAEFGITTSLFLSAVGLLGVAVVASRISKRYIG